MKKKKIFHFYNGMGGGVFSVIQCLLLQSYNEQIEYHLIYTINKEILKDFIKPKVTGAATEQVFYYSPRWNFYHLCKKLSDLLPDEECLIVAHDWLEVSMASHLGLQNPLIFFLHGDYDYYYNVATKYERAIDKFLPVADSIRERLGQLIEREKDICYLRFPVANVTTKNGSNTVCNIIFIGRLTREKGYDLLPEIARQLAYRNEKVVWHIVGDKETDVCPQWDEDTVVHFHGNIPNEEVLGLLCFMDILILPSLAEGMPIAVIEAMKAGVVPVVNNIAGGIQELIVNGITGYKIDNNFIGQYVERIIELIHHSSLKEGMSDNCVQKANALFDPNKNTVALEKLFLEVIGERKTKKAFKIHGSRLDVSWLPNVVVFAIRKIISGV